MKDDRCMISVLSNHGDRTYFCSAHGCLGGDKEMVTHGAAYARRRIPQLEALIEAEAILKEHDATTKS